MTHSLARFDKIYIINLVTRTDRRREMEQQLARIGLSFNAPNVQLFAAVRPDSPGGFPSVGARGCFTSHLEILRDAVARGHRRILILEDDLNFSADFVERSETLLMGLDGPGISMFYGGYELADPISAGLFGLREVDPAIPIRTTHFVGFQGDAIAQACNYLDAMLKRPAGHTDGGPMHVDGAYSWFRQAHPGFKTVVAVPELGHQRASRTDIHNLSWYDKLPVMRNLVAAVRRSRNG